MMDWLGGQDLLDEKRDDPKPRIAGRQCVATGFIEPGYFAALDQNVFPLVVRDPPG
jgi:hypothetical protein